MKKIVLIPLDERPCNYNFARWMAIDTEYEVVVPPEGLMGNKKIPADIDGIWKWLINEVEDAYGLVLSIDTLLYGGIVPSRLHSYTYEEGLKRLSGLLKLKEINPYVKIFAFNLIMRCPSYSSCDEEPDYYEDYGLEIFKSGYIEHKIQCGIASDAEKIEIEEIGNRLPEKYLRDYLERRIINTKLNMAAIDYVKNGAIDFMLIPQDDSAPYGYTARDQQSVRSYINEMGLALKIYMYPGADEAANTLVARMINEDKKVRPLVYVRYSSTLAPESIPLYEDRILNETVKYQIMAAGGLVASCICDADIVLLINAPGGDYLNAYEAHLRGIEYNVFRNLIELVEYADFVISKYKKPVIIGDVAYGNGSDLELVRLINQKGLTYKLAAYAGWNTSSNTLGTCIPQGMIFNIYGYTKGHRDFLALRYVEDAGYCAFVRQKVCSEYLNELGLDYFHADGKRGRVSEIVKRELEDFVESSIPDEKYIIRILDTYMPWSRMFEVGLRVETEDKM